MNKVKSTKQTNYFTKHMRYFLYAIFCLFILSCGGKNITDDNYAEIIDQEYPPEITFEEQTYNFGTVIEGDIVKHTFVFTNTGKGTLVIGSVNGSCGCTIPKNWPKEPIKPGEKGQIDVVFNSENRVGIVRKSVDIKANTKPTSIQAFIEGTVVGPESQKN